MSIAAVAHRHVFGLKGDVKDNVGFVDEQTVFYPAGANTVLYSTETKTQKFIPVTDRSEGITAMAISGPSKRYLAIAERKSDKPIVAIYDLHTLRRRKILSAPDIESKEFVCIAFSSDSKYIIAQSGAPEWTLYYWTWEKTKLMASIRTANMDQKSQPIVVYQVSFNPNDNTQLCVVGNGIFKMFRYQEGTLKPLTFQKIETKNFTCHCWTADDRILVGTDDAKLLIVESNGDLKGELSNLHGAGNSPRGVYSLVSYSKGFVCGGSGGSVVVYEKGDDVNGPTIVGGAQQNQTMGQQLSHFELYRKSRDFTLHDENAKVINMALSPTEETLVCSLENSQVVSILLSGTEVKGDDAKFEALSQPFHHGQITGMDTCIRKPLIATCSSDRSVRVWNYLENTSELVKYFPEEAYSVAIHPSGLYILVGFSDKLRLMNLLIDDIRPFREFTIRGCRECRFSSGGQYFAAVHGNTIQIYSTWNFENLGNLKGHNGKVRSIYWTQDDSKIVTAGMDGAIYDWGLKDLTGGSGSGGVKREGESILKSCSYTCAVATPDGKTIYAVGSDKTLKEIIDSQIVREIESDAVLTQVSLSHSGRMMFTGTVWK
ncbi:quinon protein alcohol dehydrogenase-like superfamily [Cladochytrium replicatum]|nr:quinon protein alcohol dehydrogenase-like superfamily [Cladochytrium replicatum]